MGGRKSGEKEGKSVENAVACRFGNLTAAYRWKRQRSKIDKWQMQNSWKAGKLCSFPDAEKIYINGRYQRREGQLERELSVTMMANKK